MTHIPGPWKADFEEMGGYDCMTDAWDVKAGTHHICTIDLSYYGQESDKAKANALLIASAPDLRNAACIALQTLLKLQKGNPADIKGTLKELYKALDKTIGKE